MGAVNRNSSHSPVWPWVCLIVCFLGCMICLYVGVCFVLPWSVESFPFMFWRWRNKLKWAPFEFFAPSPSPHYCGLGAGSIPFMPLWTTSNARWGGYLCRWSSTTEYEMYKTPMVLSASEMTDIVSGGALNSSLTRSLGVFLVPVSSPAQSRCADGTVRFYD